MTKTEKKTRIIPKYGTSQVLAKIFNCTTVTVSQALRGKTNSALADKIRHTALTQYGGVEIKEK